MPRTTGRPFLWRVERSPSHDEPPHVLQAVDRPEPGERDDHLVGVRCAQAQLDVLRRQHLAPQLRAVGALVVAEDPDEVRALSAAVRDDGMLGVGAIDQLRNAIGGRRRGIRRMDGSQHAATLGTTADAECGIGVPRQRPGEKPYEAESVESESISCPPRAPSDAIASLEPAPFFLPARPTVRATVPALRDTTPATPVMAEPA